MRRLRASAVPAELEAETLCRDVARQMDVSPPSVWRSPFLFSPCLDGLRRPAILLPEDVSKNLRETFIHELRTWHAATACGTGSGDGPRRASGSSRCSGCSRVVSSPPPKKSATILSCTGGQSVSIMPGIFSSSPGALFHRWLRSAWEWSRCGSLLAAGGPHSRHLAVALDACGYSCVGCDGGRWAHAHIHRGLTRAVGGRQGRW